MTDKISKERAVFYERRKKRRRKIVIKRLLLTLFTIALISLIVYCGTWIYGIFNPKIYHSDFIAGLYGNTISKNVEKATELQMPDWIDEQIIHKHTTARTGIKLTDIKDIVIHYVGNPNTTAQNNRDYFDKIDTRVSSHFIVGLDGEIIQCVPLFERSAASNDRNKDTISIEVCHPDETGKFNDTTYNSVIKLTSWLLNEFSLDENDIIRHYDITGKICPKYYVENEDEWTKFIEDVKSKSDEN